VAAFHYDFKDRQVQVYNPPAGTKTTNAASAKINGGEADLAWVPIKRLELGAGVGYIDAKYSSYPDGQASVPCADVSSLSISNPAEQTGVTNALASCTATGGLGVAIVGGRDLSGNRLEAAPDFTGYVRGQYTVPTTIGGITLGATLSYRSSAYWDPANVYKDPSRPDLSARIAWASLSHRWGLSVYGENLTNKEYNEQVLVEPFGGFRVPARPRAVYGRVDYHY
jgi:iron complex outermembrane receptor protein